MQIAIYVRSNIPWEEMTLDNFLNHPGHAVNIKEAHQRDVLIERIAWWNELFGMSYFEYRRRLRDIATLCFDRICGLDVLFRDFTALQNWIREVDNGWVLPVDDDDWFSPNIAVCCRQYDPARYHVIMWGLVRVYTTAATTKTADDVQYPPPYTQRRALCTNMYGISNHNLRGLPVADQRLLLTSHSQALELATASTTFATGNAPRVVAVPRLLAATHKSMASFTQLRKVSCKALLPSILARGANAFGRILYPDWSQPYSRQASELYHELLESQCNTPT